MAVGRPIIQPEWRWRQSNDKSPPARQLIEDEELEKLEPSRQAIVEINMNDGGVLRDYVTAVRGTVDNPMPRSEIIRKARDLCEPIIGKPQMDALVDKVFTLETLRSVREFRSVLQKA